MGRAGGTLTAAVIIVGLAACGAAKTPRATTFAGSSPATPSTTPTATRLPSCATRVRTTARAPVVTPGACTAGGVTLILAAAGQTVRLGTLTAREVGARLTRSVGSLAASGTFLVVTLAVSNRQSTPAAFDTVGATQTALQASNSNFRESAEAESGADPRACPLAGDLTEIQPGAVETCDVIFDVPGAVAQHVRVKGGGLLIVNFGDSIDSITRAVTEPGLLTLRPVG